ncbi:unnamed protein product [Protopolystoma xenopodis]|uniref:Uncharacterized protein n=1 Tax=Protopolystoma xenopodis TaxID=117903 RepID=A0A3S5FCA2_9PLAT|nr:unnamed protein product [Protopolystoma xenopodis]
MCMVPGALGFLADTLSWHRPSPGSVGMHCSEAEARIGPSCLTKSVAIAENSAGILRNLSSVIASREDYRYVFMSWMQLCKIRHIMIIQRAWF